MTGLAPLRRAICGGCDTDLYLHAIDGRWRCPECGHIAGPSRSTWTRETIIDAIHRWVDRHGQPPVKRQWNTAGRGRPTNTTVCSVFGTWNAAIEAAGYSPRPQHKQSSYA